MFFRTPQKQSGFDNPAIFNILKKARAETDLDKRIALYKQANNMIMRLPAGRPVRPHEPGARVPEERQGLRAEPGHPVLESVRYPSSTRGQRSEP